MISLANTYTRLQEDLANGITASINTLLSTLKHDEKNIPKLCRNLVEIGIEKSLSVHIFNTQSCPKDIPFDVKIDIIDQIEKLIDGNTQT